MKRHNSFRFSFGLAILGLSFVALALTPQAALAQHGGGGHGGGGHVSGGGGGHFGSFGGGGAHAAGSTGSHSAASPHPASRPRSSSTNAARIPNADSLPPGMVGALRNTGTAGKGIAAFSGPPAHTTIGFPPAESSATTFANVRAHSGPLSFSGQGHEIWQNSEPATPGAFSNLRNPSAVTRPAPPHIIRPFPPYGFQGQSAFFYPYGYGYFPLFGLGYGFGCDPFDPWGCYGYGFGAGYYGYPGPAYDNGYDSGYGYYDNSNSYPPPLDNGEPPSTNGLEPQSPDDSSANPSSDEPYDVNAHNSWQNPPASDASSQNNAVAAAPYSVLYLRDGSNFEVRDYWVAEGKLHYVTSYGGENAVDLGQVDLQRSVDANAARGLTFSLHPAQPTPLTPPPSSDSAPAQPSPDSAPQR